MGRCIRHIQRLFCGFGWWAIVIISGISFLVISGDIKESRDEEKYLPIIKKIFIVSLSLTILAVFVPSKETVYKMYATKFITYESVQLTGAKLDECFDKLVKAIEKSKK